MGKRKILADLKKFLLAKSGQDLAEYGIALAVIGIGAAAAALAISGDVTTLWTNAQTVIGTAL